MKPTEVITLLLRHKFIPECAVDVKWDSKGNLSYLHPRKGWKRLSIVRIGDFLKRWYRAYLAAATPVVPNVSAEAD